MIAAGEKHQKAEGSLRYALTREVSARGVKMKKLFAVAAMAVPLFAVAPVSAHHMADGVVSDDIYDDIEENLEGSPHLELDLTTVGSGSATMSVLSVTVSETDVDEVLEYIGDALASEEGMQQEGGDAFAGEGMQRESSLDVDISAPDSEGLVTIIIMENIGQGESQESQIP